MKDAHIEEIIGLLSFILAAILWANDAPELFWKFMTVKGGFDIICSIYHSIKEDAK